MLRPRSSGKTTYLKELADKLNGCYVDCTYIDRQALICEISLTRNKVFILDEPLQCTPAFLEWLEVYFDRHDFYMQATPTQRIQDSHPSFYKYLQTNYPEVLI